MDTGFSRRRREEVKAAVKGGALCGLETGTPSCLESPPATWARRTPGEGAWGLSA